MCVSFFSDFIFNELSFAKDLCCPAPVEHVPKLVWYGNKHTGTVTRTTQVTVWCRLVRWVPGVPYAWTHTGPYTHTHTHTRNRQQSGTAEILNSWAMTSSTRDNWRGHGAVTELRQWRCKTPLPPPPPHPRVCSSNQQLPYCQFDKDYTRVWQPATKCVATKNEQDYLEHRRHRQYLSVR